MNDQALPWPPPTQWVSYLSNSLCAIDTLFLSLNAINRGNAPFPADEGESIGVAGDVQSDITHQYARILSRLINSLRSLPPFADGTGLAARYTFGSTLQLSTTETARPDCVRAKVDPETTTLVEGWGSIAASTPAPRTGWRLAICNPDQTSKRRG